MLAAFFQIFIMLAAVVFLVEEWLLRRPYQAG